MESRDRDWRAAAREQFFKEHKSIGEIARITGISRQSLSGFLKGLPGYKNERDQRKERNAFARKEYKREKNREYRAMGAITAETIRREHNVAALILSREKYH